MLDFGLVVFFCFYLESTFVSSVLHPHVSSLLLLPSKQGHGQIYNSLLEVVSVQIILKYFANHTHTKKPLKWHPTARGRNFSVWEYKRSKMIFARCYHCRLLPLDTVCPRPCGFFHGRLAHKRPALIVLHCQLKVLSCNCWIIVITLTKKRTQQRSSAQTKQPTLWSWMKCWHILPALSPKRFSLLSRSPRSHSLYVFNVISRNQFASNKRLNMQKFEVFKDIIKKTNDCPRHKRTACRLLRCFWSISFMSTFEIHHTSRVLSQPSKIKIDSFMWDSRYSNISRWLKNWYHYSWHRWQHIFLF